MAKVLIVDDDKILRERLKHLLELDDYQTFTAEDGRKGLEVCHKEKPEIALVDIKMPDMSGIEVLKKIKEKEKTDVIIITGHGGVETAIQALKEGAHGYIQKPIEYAELKIEIERVIEKQEMQRKLNGYVHDLEEAVKEKTRELAKRKRAEKEKTQIEARLQQAQKMEAIGVLAGGIAHNFNNLLMAIQGNVSLMLFDIDSTHPFYELLTTIKDAIKDGAQLARQLLGYARKGKYFSEPINLNELVEKTSESIDRARKGISIHRELAEELFAIEADQSQIEQVLMNLFVNAADAMPAGGDLILKTANATDTDMEGKAYDVKLGNYVRLTVTDTGSGMDKETQERIFEPFFTTKEMGSGTGLGLASVYGIIKGHAGYIEVDSGLGRGTTFSIYLPATDEKVEKTIEPVQQIIKGNGTILLVDDEDMVIDVATKVLKRLGYTVLEARSGKEAIDIYKENKDKIALVLLDMVMPDVGGGEAYDRMKEINLNVKVLLSSGYSIDSEAKEILARGCDAFIQKPFGMQELSVRIREVLEKK